MKLYIYGNFMVNRSAIALGGEEFLPCSIYCWQEEMQSSIQITFAQKLNNNPSNLFCLLLMHHNFDRPFLLMPTICIYIQLSSKLFGMVHNILGFVLIHEI